MPDQTSAEILKRNDAWATQQFGAKPTVDSILQETSNSDLLSPPDGPPDPPPTSAYDREMQRIDKANAMLLFGVAGAPQTTEPTAPVGPNPTIETAPPLRGDAFFRATGSIDAHAYPAGTFSPQARPPQNAMSDQQWSQTFGSASPTTARIGEQPPSHRDLEWSNLFKDNTPVTSRLTANGDSVRPTSSDRSWARIFPTSSILARPGALKPTGPTLPNSFLNPDGFKLASKPPIRLSLGLMQGETPPLPKSRY